MIQSLELRNISKRFGAVVANENINLGISSGEILGLLGENGAGKSTLMKILFGIYSPDNGGIFVNGKHIKISSPADSIKIGIGMVHQHFMLVSNHTVAENIALGLSDIPFFFPQAKIRNKINEFNNKYGFDVNPDAYIWQLSAGEQQRVEIIKVLIRGAELLIMDEPTSVLTPSEVSALFNALKKFVSAGGLVAFISHKLDEIMDITDKVVVLRRGRVTGQVDTGDTTKEELARMIFDRDVALSVPFRDSICGSSVLEVVNLNVFGDMGVEACRNLSFSVRENEIFGIAGVAGNGQKELIETITGLREPASGSIFIKGKDITNKSPDIINASGVAHIPEERMKFGVVSSLSVCENAALKDQNTHMRFRGVFIDYGKIKELAERIVKEYSVSAPSVESIMGNLSGGNIQKFITGRELLAEPSLIVAAHPTYGVDVGTTEFIRKKLIEKRDTGSAVLLVSEDLEELFQLCNRIAVMFRGRFMGVIDHQHIDMDKIALWMTGVSGN
ncbi:MAG: Galactose/methyl galactoside import ATP-binding protein MglA [Elusimicrobia bacterium ADurb.Bin231]|nr:MAG: Galactose/methyl galactoside import ATP-binding protein MglA [Elusimicrobia bacterium ADurb.Bin231]